jgi:small subunit ribosomal protein S17
MQSETGKSRTVPGVVVSARMDKTITVLIERKVAHPLYRKFVKRITKLYAHDEDNSCKENDKVLIQECRPLSKKKSWRLVKILGNGSS